MRARLTLTCEIEFRDEFGYAECLTELKDRMEEIAGEIQLQGIERPCAEVEVRCACGESHRPSRGCVP